MAILTPTQLYRLSLLVSQVPLKVQSRTKQTRLAGIRANIETLIANNQFISTYSQDSARDVNFSDEHLAFIRKNLDLTEENYWQFFRQFR